MKKIIIAILILSLAVPAYAQMRKAAGGTPTMGTCGTSPSVTGKDEGGVIRVGTSMASVQCILNFSQTYGAAPACVAANKSSVTKPVERVITSTTQMTLEATSAFDDSSDLSYICIMP